MCIFLCNRIEIINFSKGIDKEKNLDIMILKTEKKEIVKPKNEKSWERSKWQNLKT